MDPDNINKTPKKTNNHELSNKDEQTCLSIQNKSPILDKKSKCRSQINIRQKKQFNKLNEQLNELKQKVDISKDILTTIYSKVRLKQAKYEKEISTKDYQIFKTNKLVNDYKMMYEDEFRKKEECIDRQIELGKERLDQNLDHEARLKIRKNVLQRIKKKGVVFNQDLLHSILTIKQNQSKTNENQSLKTKTRQKDSTPIKRVIKSHSQINHKKTKSLIIQAHKQSKPKLYKPAPRQNHTTSIVEKTSNQDAKRQNFRLAENKKMQISPSDDKRTLYDIYKQRITKRQRQQNSQKMSWVVQKFQENLKDLQMIRKKSQLKLSQIKKQAQNENQIDRKKKDVIKKQQSHKKIHNQALKQLQEIKRKRSKEKYIQLQKSKLKNLDQAK